jgi:hypothetical protein
LLYHSSDKSASWTAQDLHYWQVCGNRVRDYQYQFENCRDLDTRYMGHEGSSAQVWIQYMNGLMACSCCPHGTASLRNKRTNPNLLCLSRLHVALPIPHATSEVLCTRPQRAVLLLFANCRYTHPLTRDGEAYYCVSLSTFEPRKPYSAPAPDVVSAVVKVQVF